jgi:hypothetical protein
MLNGLEPAVLRRRPKYLPAHPPGTAGEGGGAGRQDERRTQSTDLAQRLSSTSAEVRRGPQRASRGRPRMRVGCRPAAGSCGSSRATIASRRERMSGLRSSGRPRSAPRSARPTSSRRAWNHRRPRRPDASAISADLGNQRSDPLREIRPLRALVPQETDAARGAVAPRAADTHHPAPQPIRRSRRPGAGRTARLDGLRRGLANHSWYRSTHAHFTAVPGRHRRYRAM